MTLFLPPWRGHFQECHQNVEATVEARSMGAIHEFIVRKVLRRLYISFEASSGVDSNG